MATHVHLPVAADTGPIQPTYTASDKDIDQHFVDVFGPTKCDMKASAPFDFAWCEAHDMTFPLGGTCPFNKISAKEADDA